MRFGLILIVLVGWVSTGVLCAQNEDAGMDIVKLYDGAVQAGNSGDVDKGLALCGQAIAQYENGREALELYGPVFGHFYYMRGMLLIRKKQYDQAIAALKVCHEKYDNKFLKTYKPPPDDPRNLLPNRYMYHALMQWGFVLMVQEKFKEAVPILEKTLVEDPKTEPRIDRLMVQMNLAKAYILSGQEKKGKDFIMKLLDSDQIGMATKRVLFKVLAYDWSPRVAWPEVRTTMLKYVPLVESFSPNDRAEDNTVFLNLAARAQRGEEMPGAKGPEVMRALLFYSMMVNPAVSMQYWKERAEFIRGRRKFYAEQEVTNEAEKERKAELLKQADGLIQDAVKKQEEFLSVWHQMLLGEGACYYQISSISAARATYKVMIDNFAKFPERALVLHNLVVCDTNLGMWEEAYKYGMIFFEEFPEHELKPSVARVLVEVLYVQGKYQEAYDISKDIRPKLPEGSSIREIPDFVYGAAAFHLDKYAECEEGTEYYLKTYPEGRRVESVRFYLGSAKVRLEKWREAAPILESFLMDYPESVMRPSVLFLSGLTHLVIEELDIAFDRVTTLQENYPSAEEVPASHNVRGDVLKGMGEEYEAVIPDFKRAKALVEEDGRGNSEVAAYAVRQLIASGAEAEDWGPTAGYYDEFKDRYWESSQKMEAAVAALPALANTEGRKDEGRDLIERFVKDNAKGEVTPQLDLLFGTYFDYLQNHYSADEVDGRLDHFPWDNPNQPEPALEAWIVMARIDAEEKKEKPDAKKVRDLFIRLSAKYKENGLALSNYTLVRLARWNWEERNMEDEARKVYQFILNERGASDESAGFALVDLGKLESKSQSAEIRGRALERFERVLKEITNDDLREEATLGKARLLRRDQKWDGALAAWKEYLKDRSWNLSRAEANFGVAEALDKKGEGAEALKLYVNVYANFAGHLDWSTAAYLRVAEMKKAKKEDKNALLVLQDMLTRMGHHDHPNIQKARDKFNAWRVDFEAGGG